MNAKRSRRLGGQMWWSWATMFSVGTVALMACADPSAPRLDPVPIEDVLQSLRLEPRALTMAVDDTFALDLTAYNVKGEEMPIDSETSVMWTSSDGRLVQVDSVGRVIAIDTTDVGVPVSVQAFWTYKGVTRTDTVRIGVTPTRQPVTALQLIPLDSSRTASNTSFMISMFMVAATRDGGIPVPNIYYSVFVNDHGENLGAWAFPFGDGLYVAWLPPKIGRYYIRAAATVYGIPLRDSLPYMGLYPAETAVQIYRDTLSGAIISAKAGVTEMVQPCAWLQFQNSTLDTLDIIFDEPANVSGCADPAMQGAIVGGGGNILGIAPGAVGARKIPVLGKTRWTARLSVSGALIPNLTGVFHMRDPEE
jgi:hypothetical protein